MRKVIRGRKVRKANQVQTVTTELKVKKVRLVAMAIKVKKVRRVK